MQLLRKVHLYQSDWKEWKGTQPNSASYHSHLLIHFLLSKLRLHNEKKKKRIIYSTPWKRVRELGSNVTWKWRIIGSRIASHCSFFLLDFCPGKKDVNAPLLSDLGSKTNDNKNNWGGEKQLLLRVRGREQWLNKLTRKRENLFLKK